MNKFINFRLNFSRNMSNMHNFRNKFSKIASTGSSPSLQRRLIFDFSDLKLHDLAKLWFLKLIYDEIEFYKNQL